MQDSQTIAKKVEVELIKLLYQQIKPALWAESLTAIGLVAGLWGTTDARILIGWLLFNLLFCGLARHLLVYWFEKSTLHTGLVYEKTRYWERLFTVGVFFSGLSWGAAGSFLIFNTIQNNDVLQLTFTAILLLGVVSAANPIYSYKRNIYILFLVIAFVPFSIWLLLQNQLFVILGLLCYVYIGIMIATSFFLNHLVYTSLYLKFENNDLIDNLSRAKTDLEKGTQKLERSLSLVKATLESTTDGILVVTADNKIENYNVNFINALKVPLTILENNDSQIFFDYLLSQLDNAFPFKEKIILLQTALEDESYDELQFKDNRIFECYSHPQRLGKQPVGRVWTFRDVTAHKLLENKLIRQANIDTLTGLPNRALTIDRISQAIHYTRRGRNPLAILFLDLDRFKLINDTLGHTIGDKLLIAVANRLVKSIGDLGTVSREGGDEFIVILNSLTQESDSIHITNEILKNIREPFMIDGKEINITISIGVSFFPKDGEDAELLIRNADIAMYHAKELGRNNFQFFTEETNQKVVSRMQMENQIRNALEKNEFSLVYQPIISLKNANVSGYEALLRWKPSKSSTIAPADFISLAEETGAIVQIGEWVLRKACLQANEWRKLHSHAFHVAVNLSARQFRQPNFLEQLEKILHETQCYTENLALEITEGTIMEDAAQTITLLQKLKAMGISVMIDDFGTGYSSLNYLKRLPVDKIKIDRSFIKDIPHRADDTAITAAIIALATKLNIKIIAEGVENIEQLKFLYEHNCDEIQGFYFYEPLEASECTRLIANNIIKLPF